MAALSGKLLLLDHQLLVVVICFTTEFVLECRLLPHLAIVISLVRLVVARRFGCLRWMEHLLWL